METETTRSDRTRARRTRFTVGNPPPRDDEIRRLLTREIGRSGLPKARVQSLIANELRRGQPGADTGPADEVLRYLQNERFVKMERNTVSLVEPPEERTPVPAREIMPGGPLLPVPLPSFLSQPQKPPSQEVTMTTKQIDSDILSYPCRRFRSGNLEFYEMTVPAATLAKFGRVTRHEENADGVQRGLRLPHVKQIANAMRSGTAFPENMLVNLEGNWSADDEMVIGDPKDKKTPAVFDILDGQHRLAAILALIDSGEHEIVGLYEFKIIAVIGANKDERRSLFRLQTERLSVDRSHLLELAAEDGNFATNGTAHAYKLAKMLSETDRSPLKGLVIFGEKHGEKGRKRIKEGEFHISSLLIFLRVLGGETKGVMRRFPLERRGEILIDLFRAADSVYGKFLDPKHPLGQATGICTLIAILATEGHFHLVISRKAGGSDDPYTYENMRSILETVSRFMWKLRANSPDAMRMQPYTVAKRFNNYLASHDA